MIYNSKEEIKDKFIEIDPLDDFNNHCKEFDFFNSYKNFSLSHRDMGRFFLYENVIYKSPNKYNVFYPKLGIYLNELPCDQTTEVEWIDYRRTSEWRHKYKFTISGNEYTNYLAEIPTEVNRLPLWMDSMLVYGVWNGMPNWKELKDAYRKTWWFKRTIEQNREIQISSILR